MKAVVETNRGVVGSKWTFTEIEASDDELFDRLTEVIRSCSGGEVITIRLEQEEEDDDAQIERIEEQIAREGEVRCETGK